MEGQIYRTLYTSSLLEPTLGNIFFTICLLKNEIQLHLDIRITKAYCLVQTRTDTKVLTLESILHKNYKQCLSFVLDKFYNAFVFYTTILHTYYENLYIIKLMEIQRISILEIEKRLKDHKYFQRKIKHRRIQKEYMIFSMRRGFRGKTILSVRVQCCEHDYLLFSKNTKNRL
ncbi:hypothetical protein ACJX0J_030675, partial [Zea mays]